MFTGIIQGLGHIENILKVKDKDATAQLTIDLGKLSHRLKIGGSVSVNGVCLTIIKLYKNKARFEMINETIKKTTLGLLTLGDMVNIERSLKVGDTIDGHFVFGHVDGVGKIIDKIKQRTETKLWISIDKKLLKYIVPKGSIAIDGVSLTVVDVMSNRFSIALIPHTITMTILGNKKNNDQVNVEVDILGKYAKKALINRY